LRQPIAHTARKKAAAHKKAADPAKKAQLF